MKTVSILLLDDVPYVRQLVATELSALGGVKDIYEADSSANAIATMMEHRPDLMILDINVPGGVVDGVRYTSGIDVLRAAKERLSDATVIMLTNNANEYYRRECKKAGADFFFDKTTEFDDFLVRLKVLIEERKFV